MSANTRTLSENILFTQRAKKYQGMYIAVARNRVVASGRHAREAYSLAQHILRHQREKVDGVYYIPRKQDLLTALCVFRTFR